MSIVHTAPRQPVTDPSECFFYHTMELPEIGLVRGMWDLRGGEEQYLGGVSFEGKTVLELGPASGFISFYMEKHGADVLGYDLSEEQAWDVVPYAELDTNTVISDRKDHIRRLNNSFWFAHNLLRSKAKISYGSVYSISEDLGLFDVAVVGSILLHLRDPFFALQKTLSRTRETVIVTDMLSRYHFKRLVGLSSLLPKKLRRPTMAFVPDFTKGFPRDTWWRLNPQIVKAYLGVLGFEHTTITYHHQPLNGKMLPLFTVVGRRTRGFMAK